MFKVGDIVKPIYESGSGSFRVVEVINETNMLVSHSNSKYCMAVKMENWIQEPVKYRKIKLTKILNKLK